MTQLARARIYANVDVACDGGLVKCGRQAMAVFGRGRETGPAGGNMLPAARRKRLAPHPRLPRASRACGRQVRSARADAPRNPHVGWIGCNRHAATVFALTVFVSRGVQTNRQSTASRRREAV
jgi:hypothetical protein